MARLFLCTDMDRTLLPNGDQQESANVRQYFSKFVQHEHVLLAYVTGRHLDLVLDAVGEYDLPMPDFALTDVGTCIYQRQNQHWELLDPWEQEIDKDWSGQSHQDLVQLFDDLTVLQLQEADKQNKHKLSYYLSLDIDRSPLLTDMEQRLAQLGVSASLVWSVDEQAEIGLLDVLPKNATKLHAVDFIREQSGYGKEEVVFCGDSGNDLAVMESDIPSVLVANAHEEVIHQAVSLAKAAEHDQCLYIAQGDFVGLNGNYAAGILEGIWHFQPSFRREIERVCGYNLRP